MPVLSTVRTAEPWSVAGLVALFLLAAALGRLVVVAIGRLDRGGDGLPPESS